MTGCSAWFRCSSSLKTAYGPICGRRRLSPRSLPRRSARRWRIELLRLRLVDAVPIRRRRIGAIRGNALGIHVVKAFEIEAVADRPAAFDQAERVVPLLLAKRSQHLRVERAQDRK